MSILGHLKTKNREYSFSRCKAFLGSHDPQRRAHDTPHMSSDATPTVMIAASGDTTTTTTPASLADAGEAFLTTSSSSTFDGLSISTIPQISRGSLW